MSGDLPAPPTVQMEASYQMSEFVGIDETLTVYGDGDLEITVISTESSQANAWVINADKGGSYGSDFETRLTKNSGDDPISGDSVGSYLTINTSRVWAWATGSTYNFTLDIREIAEPSTNIDTTTISQF